MQRTLYRVLTFSENKEFSLFFEILTKLELPNVILCCHCSFISLPIYEEVKRYFIENLLKKKLYLKKQMTKMMFVIVSSQIVNIHFNNVWENWGLICEFENPLHSIKNVKNFCKYVATESKYFHLHSSYPNLRLTII